LRRWGHLQPSLLATLVSRDFLYYCKNATNRLVITQFRKNYMVLSRVVDEMSKNKTLLDILKLQCFDLIQISKIR